MKKSLILFSVAALALVSCAKVQDVYTPEAQEIAFQAVSTPTTRAAVDGTDFPTTIDIQVAAYDVTNTRDFFTPTTFTHAGSKTYTGDASAKDYWTGGKYWPLSPTDITFLGYTNFQGTAGSETDGATWGATHKASGVTLVMTDNKTAQKDLMYACGTGSVTQSGNTLTFPKNVPMTFKHAQAWISFYADAYDATSGGKVTLTSITLNGAKYNGKFTVTHNNYTNTSTQNVTGAWSELGSTTDVAVPNWTPDAIAYDSSGDGVVVGDGLMIVPDDNSATADFTSFTIAYSLDGKAYTYTYTPATDADKNVDQAKHYIYKINFHLHEIEITPTVTDWDDQTAVDVPIF